MLKIVIVIVIVVIVIVIVFKKCMYVCIRRVLLLLKIHKCTKMVVFIFPPPSK